MNTEIKNKILYSNEVTELITKYKADLIFLGGSRLLGLETSEENTDYDVIAIGNYNLSYWNFKDINISNIKAHVKSHNILSCINAIDKSVTANTSDYWFLMSVPFLNNTTLYTKSTATPILNLLNTYKKELCILGLEGMLYNIKRDLLSKVLYKYEKAIYHFYTFYLLLENIELHNSYEYTTEQKEFLLDLKINKYIPKGFIELLHSLKTVNPYSWRYNYSKIKREVLEAWVNT